MWSITFARAECSCGNTARDPCACQRCSETLLGAIHAHQYVVLSEASRARDEAGRACDTRMRRG